MNKLLLGFYDRLVFMLYWHLTGAGPPLV